MLGTASSSLGVVVFVVTLRGILTARGSEWHAAREIWRVGTIYVPSPYTIGLGLFAIALGILGVVFSRRHGKLSWTSVFGIALVFLSL
jgi:hypothetical protein